MHSTSASAPSMHLLMRSAFWCALHVAVLEGWHSAMFHESRRMVGVVGVAGGWESCAGDGGGEGGGGDCGGKYDEYAEHEYAEGEVERKACRFGL